MANSGSPSSEELLNLKLEFIVLLRDILQPVNVITLSLGMEFSQITGKFFT